MLLGFGRVRAASEHDGEIDPRHKNDFNYSSITNLHIETIQIFTWTFIGNSNDCNVVDTGMTTNQIFKFRWGNLK